MRSNFIVCLLLGTALLLVGCTGDRGVAPESACSDNDVSGITIDVEQMARDIVQSSRWELDQEVDPPIKTEQPGDEPIAVCVLDYERECVGDDVYHYNWQVRIGPDPFDVIGLHRVVKERAPYRPIRTHKSVFMLHGDFKDFEGCFLPGMLSEYKPAGFGIAAYLAEGDVDVWGMDQAHNSIPAGETDFSSMADWDMSKYVQDTRAGIAVVRFVRLLTGDGFRKVNLLGYSGGSALGFAVVNEEVALPGIWRQVGGFVPMDQGMFTDDADFAASDCATAQYYADLIDSGEFAEANPLPYFGGVARTDPAGPSGLIPGFTNLQAALALAVYPYAEGFPHHLLAGEFDADGMPAGLQYTDVDFWIDFLIQAPPYFANAFSRDEYISSCGAEYAPWTHRLGEVELPVLYVSAAGGFGLAYAHTLESMVSADVSMLTVALHPAEEVGVDFAHVDLFTADNAPELVWEPILQWIVTECPAANENHIRVAGGGM